jgi:quercetin dioxygenase-like cupin family protein
MTHEGYAVASLARVDWTETGPGIRHVPLTGRLGCTDTDAAYYRLEADRRVTLTDDREALVVPFDAPLRLLSERESTVPRRGVARIPARMECAVRSDADTALLVVRAPVASPSETAPVVVDTETLAFTEPTTSDVLIARLTEPLGCLGVKANVRLLRPGDAVPYHTEGSQEELFVPLDGPGRLRVAGRTHDLAPGDVARVAPAVPRGAVNGTDGDVRWLMVGAPPTGGAEEWDPGAEIVEWPHAG